MGHCAPKLIINNSNYSLCLPVSPGSQGGTCWQTARMMSPHFENKSTTLWLRRVFLHFRCELIFLPVVKLVGLSFEMSPVRRVIKNFSCWQPGRQAGSPFPMGNNCNYTLPEWSPRGNKSKGYLFTPPYFLPRILILPSVPLPPNKCASIYIQFPDPSR